MKQAEDQQILDWISSKDQKEKGFRSLVEKYKEKLYWHVRRMVLNHDDADDVLQNTFTVYTRPSGNSLKFKRTNFFNDKKTWKIQKIIQL